MSLCALPLGLGAFYWLTRTPDGFPWHHPKTTANLVIPILFLSLTSIALVALKKNWLTLLLWLQAAVIGGFFVSLWSLFSLYRLDPGLPLMLVLLSAPLLGAFAAQWWEGPSPTRSKLLSAVAFGLLLGSVLCFAQRAADPATRPKEALTHWPQLHPEETIPRKLELSPGNAVDYTNYDPCLEMKRGSHTLNLWPLLRFDSCAPDRFWSVLVPPRFASRYYDLQAARATSSKVVAHYRGSDEAWLELDSTNPNEINITTETRLIKAVYSHHNSYTRLTLGQLKQPWIKFSVVPEKVYVQFAGYSRDRPLRFAYLDQGGLFKVVEAHNAEKGPFKTLTSGRLEPGQELNAIIFDGTTPILSVTWRDWSSQASTQLSSTAGWGIPENAIQFQIGNGDTVFLHATLAATGVGRGWDSVGHKAGSYVNRMQLRWLK